MANFAERIGSLSEGGDGYGHKDRQSARFRIAKDSNRIG